MRRCRGLLLLVALALAPIAGAMDAPRDAIAQGKPDGKVPGWVIQTKAPVGWTADCCMYARAVGVNLVIYQGEWTGEPIGVMVLNVWPRKLPSLEAELDADRKHYLQLDPLAKASRFPVRHRGMACEALVFQGSDRVDDAVVFCDPGKASGIRLSWSLSFADKDPQRGHLLDEFMRVVVGTTYRRGAAAHR
ncbi:MAG: hypothetical protein HOQ10_00875 [Frateuria sp.]|uniref:hypothetical protein n=1 Tax=Frateuria sp. TaxID=2211372 RepID=UPI00179E9DB3|nr:hypothetical protein [Frateuria sp.]NUO71257.1 hypothetical protein [Frateuria sp.]NUR21381.1 hypothetical protein [Frateuria sp.]